MLVLPLTSKGESSELLGINHVRLDTKLMRDNIYHESLDFYVMFKYELRLKKMSVKEIGKKKRECFWKHGIVTQEIKSKISVIFFSYIL